MDEQSSGQSEKDQEKQPLTQMENQHPEESSQERRETSPKAMAPKEEKKPLKARLRATWKKSKRFVRYCILRVLYGAASMLPLSVAMALGRGLCRLGYFVPSLRKKSLAGLSIAYPDLSDEERLQIVRGMLDNLGNFLGEVCCIDAITPRIHDYVELSDESLANYVDAHREGKGIIFVTGHVGNFELLARRVGLLGYPSNVVAKVSSDAHMTAFIDRFRRHGGYQMIWRGQGAKGSAYQAIREATLRGDATGLLIDQDTKGHGLFVDFFGRQAFTPSGAADLAIDLKSAVVTGFIHRKPTGGHILTLKRIPLPQTGDRDGDVQALLQTLTNCVEEAIREDPTAWPWFHERWKRRPPEEKESAGNNCDTTQHTPSIQTPEESRP